MCSDQRSVVCGVPQGSVLGPTLFLLYINDICNSSAVLNMILFADDTNMFHNGSDLSELCNIVTLELNKLNTWFQVNKLSLNIQKTNFIIFGNKKKMQGDFKINIHGVELQRVYVTKFLGVYIDHEFNWIEHIRVIKQKVAKNIGIITKVQQLINIEALHSLYFSLISPYLYYCSEVWGNTYISRYSSLVLLQKRAIRVINKKEYRHHTNVLFHSSGILKLTDLIQFKTLLIMYKAKHSLLPNSIQALFEYGSQHNYKTRYKERFITKRFKSRKKSMCLSIVGSQLWNKLNKEIKIIESVYIFKKSVKTFIR
jgi:hypothetical protein